MSEGVVLESELSKIIKLIESGSLSVIYNFSSYSDAVLFSYSLYNERRKKNVGKDLKISVDKKNFTVNISKKIDPVFKLF